jgi:hypothetical protein
MQNDAELLARACALGINIYQRSKTVWVAMGNYRGRAFEVRGRAPRQTITLWKEATRYRGSAL